MVFTNFKDTSRSEQNCPLIMLIGGVRPFNESFHQRDIMMYFDKMSVLKRGVLLSEAGASHELMAIFRLHFGT